MFLVVFDLNDSIDIAVTHAADLVTNAQLACFAAPGGANPNQSSDEVGSGWSFFGSGWSFHAPVIHLSCRDPASTKWKP
jgi:hypothetical protein